MGCEILLAVWDEGLFLPHSGFVLQNRCWGNLRSSAGSLCFSGLAFYRGKSRMWSSRF